MPEKTSLPPIYEVAKRLGRHLVDRHVVEVSIRWNEPTHDHLEIWVDVDELEALKSVPSRFEGYEVHTRHSGTPRFATNSQPPASPRRARAGCSAPPRAGKE